MDSSSNPSSLRDLAVDVRTLLAEARPIEWLVQGLMAIGTVIIMAASPKTGKTYLAMHLAVCVARGEPFLGRATRKQRVFYVFLEDGRRRVAWRLNQLGLVAEEDIIFFAVFDSRTVDELLVKVESSAQPVLVIIDPLVVLEAQFGVKDENAALEVEKLFARLRSATRGSGSSFLIVHHFRKAGDTMRGSVALQGSSDGWWNLARDEDRVSMLSAVLRDADETNIAFAMVNDGATMRFEIREPKARADSAAAGASLRVRILDLLRAKHPAPLSQQEVADSLNVNRSHVQAQLRALEQDGEVVRPHGLKGGYTVPASDGPAAEVVVEEPSGAIIITTARPSRVNGAGSPLREGLLEAPSPSTEEELQ